MPVVFNPDDDDDGQQEAPPSLFYWGLLALFGAGMLVAFLAWLKRGAKCPCSCAVRKQTQPPPRRSRPRPANYKTFTPGLNIQEAPQIVVTSPSPPPSSSPAPRAPANI